MRSIILTFLDADQLNQAEFLNRLHEEGFAPPDPGSQGQPTAPLVGVPSAAVLLFAYPDLGRIDAELRKLLSQLDEQGGNPAHVIICGMDLPPNDERKLRSWGATKIIQPTSWDAGAVADRVLAALFGGFGTQQNGAEGDTAEKPYLECWVPFKATNTNRKIIGATKVMREVFADIEFYSRLSDPILIRGETGTGKELVAAAIHSPNCKPPRARKYITINIAEITPSLLPNELFGHSREAFTDARGDKLGLLAEAGHGTVFIDEIGDLDKENQARLLRVFSNLEIRPVGAKHEKRVPLNARLIFATHQPLEKKCDEGKFRHDLYRRITEGHTIHLRPLRERKGDLELLAKEFFKEWNEERAGRKVSELQQGDYDKIVDLCVTHNFPGNVRGLRGILRGCFNQSLKEGKRFDIDHLKTEINIDRKQAEKSVTVNDEDMKPAPSECTVTFDPLTENLKDFLKRARSKYCTEVYKANGKSITQGAGVASLHRRSFSDCVDPKEKRPRKPRRKELSSGPEDEDQERDDDD
jgi:DNA-binding NtrC family response regulator